MASSHIFETALGFCCIAWSDKGIARFQLPEERAEIAERNLRRRFPDWKPATPTREIEGVIAEVIRYFDGERVDFSSITLDLGGQSDFFAKIYAALRRVPYGQTTTYGTLAREIGAEPQAARDVGEAMGRNPVPLIIPCHRVLAAGGKLGGFSAPGGTETKIRMLELEGVRLQPAQGSLF